MLGLKVPGIEHHVLAVVQLILRQKTLLFEWQCFQHGEIKHDVIAGFMRMRVQIPHKRILPIYPGEHSQDRRAQVSSFDHFVGVGE